MFVPDPSTGFDLLIHAARYNLGTEYIIALRGGSESESDAVIATISTSGSQNSYNPVQFVNYQGEVLAVCGGIEGFYRLYKDPATKVWSWILCSFSWIDGSGAPVSGAYTQAEAVKPRVACSYHNRMVYANFGPGKENWICFGDRENTTWPDDTTYGYTHPLCAAIGTDMLSANGRHIRLAAIQGQTIRAMVEISTSSVTNALQTALLILTERSAMLCTGEPSQTTDTDFTDARTYFGDFESNKINFDCGTAGLYSMCRGPNGTFWANGEDVYALYSGTPQPVPIGTNIRPALRACPAAMQPFWHMAYADGAVYLNLATQASGTELELITEQWRLDLRPIGQDVGVVSPQGPSAARWWGPMDYSGLMSVDNGLAGGIDLTVGHSPAIISKRGTNDQDVIYGLWFGHQNCGAYGLFLISYNQWFNGYDSPKEETAQGRAWAAAELVAVGDVVLPTAANRNGRMYVCTTGGTTDAAEPTWPTGAGGTVLDGAVTWTEARGNSAYIRWLPSWLGQSSVNNIAMEPDFKELSWGSLMNDKLVKRGDISAYFSTKSHVWMDMLVNGGNNKFFAGPAIIGGSSGAGKDPAYNELGSLTLDSSSLAEEFQARQMRPAAATIRTKPDSITPGIIRGRSIQPRLRSSTGFVIDDTNDYIVAACYNNNSGYFDSAGVCQGQLTQGYYANADTLMTEVVRALNAATPDPFGGFATGLHWSTASAYTGQFPYFNNLSLAFTTRDSDRFICLLASPPSAGNLTFEAATYYTTRSASLLAMLGFDTASDAISAGQLAINAGMTALNAAYEQGSAPVSPTPIYGIQSIPYTRPPVIAVGELELEVTAKRGRPMPNTPRTA
jgi:hypothetical protein